MSIVLRISLIVGALLVLLFVLRKIRRSELKIADALFWFLFAFSFVLLGLFPQIGFFFAGLLNIESPANFVYLYAIAVLVLHNFFITVELSKVRSRLISLIQEQALVDAKRDSEQTKKD